MSICVLSFIIPFIAYPGQSLDARAFSNGRRSVPPSKAIWHGINHNENDLVESGNAHFESIPRVRRVKRRWAMPLRTTSINLASSYVKSRTFQRGYNRARSSIRLSDAHQLAPSRHTFDISILERPREDSFIPRKSTQASKSLSDILSETPGFRTFTTLSQTIGLSQQLDSLDNVTLFIPTNYAFQATAYALGCPDVSTTDLVLNCLADKFSSEELTSILLYHVKNGISTSASFESPSIETMLNDLPVFFRANAIVDLTAGIMHARIRTDSTTQFTNGVIFPISRVLLPFVALLSSRPCLFTEYPIAIANSSFSSIVKLTAAFQKCVQVRNAVSLCELTPSLICAAGRVRAFIGYQTTLGRLISSAVLCESVAVALQSCPQGKFPWFQF